MLIGISILRNWRTYCIACVIIYNCCFLPDPYGGHPQYPSPQNPIYPQIYNPSNAPVPGQPSAPGYPAPGQYVPQPGFAYPYPQPSSGQASQPAAMSYPGIAPTAPLPSGPPYGYPGVATRTPGYPGVANVSYHGVGSAVASSKYF